MARDSKRLQQIVAMFRDLPERERLECIGRAVERLCAGPAKRGAPRRLASRDAHLAFDNELLKEHRPEWTESQRFDWLAERHGIKHKQPHVTIRKRLASPAAKAWLSSLDRAKSPK